jgi:magnesium transporter
MADATRDYVDGAIEAYRARRDERSEIGIRRLTVLAALLGPLSVLAGWYGVNFKYLPGQNDPAGFWIFVGIQLAFVAVAGTYLHRRGLL